MTTLNLSDLAGMALTAFMVLGLGWALVNDLIEIHRNHAKKRRKETALKKVFQRSGRSGAQGQGFLEYAMLVVLVAGIVMLVLYFLGYDLSRIYQGIVDHLPF